MAKDAQLMLHSSESSGHGRVSFYESESSKRRKTKTNSGGLL